MRGRTLLITLILAMVGACGAALGIERFPPPDFESGYKLPALTYQQPVPWSKESQAAVVLAIILPAAGWLLLKRRSRAGIFVLGIGSLLYFGFYRQGCICPVGSVQNVAMAVGVAGFAVPLAVVALFILPLVAALVCGRVFCGAVCPLGMAQDVFLFRPVRVPRWLEGALGLTRFFVLGLIVYFVVVQSRFRLCEYDPFVGFFRLSGPAWLLGAGGLLLMLGMFVGRPFCRYLCPYGGLLSLLSRWSSAGVRVTPDECIKCTLCEEACPFGAIHRPEDQNRAAPRLKLTLALSALAALPILGSAGWLATGRTTAGLWLGLWFGLVIAVKLIALTLRRERTEYEVDHAACLSCGRCYEYCPREHVRLKREATPEVKEA